MCQSLFPPWLLAYHSGGMPKKKVEVKSMGSEVKILDMNLIFPLSLRPPVWRVIVSTSVPSSVLQGRDE